MVRKANKSTRVPWDSSKTLQKSDSANEKPLVQQRKKEDQKVEEDKRDVEIASLFTPKTGTN
ncbi:hypothetical protein EYF80_002270 [Liparis tanakae]|uniref:Uncharacterized protein n=1 Tax=Liparis tanakae TaxID=230148 RepID=A0A4Z2JCP8_9TELE|nr:hypothetical protein EYF80_002270 [Liparis tanakae]